MTTVPCCPDLLASLAAFLESHLGLLFPPSRSQDLTRGLQAAAQELGLPDVPALADAVLHDSVGADVLGVLAAHLTIGETYFFRDKGMFTALANNILPPLLAARRAGDRRLRLWSAGCASGEEAYSLAITVHQAIPDWQNWQILLLATDINPRALAKARQGIYSRWSFRGVPDHILAAYFTPLGGDRWEVKPWMKQMVTFSPLNLAQDPFPAASTNTCDLDIIFCRHVLMYLAPEITGRILKNFAAALREGGWLLVSPAECSLIQADCFKSCAQPTAIPFQKISSTKAPSPIKPLTPAPIVASTLTRAPQPCQHNPDQSESQNLPLADQLHGRNGIQGQAPARSTVSKLSAPPLLAVPTGVIVEDREPEPAHEQQLPNEIDNAAAMAALARHYANLGRLEEANLWGARAIGQDCLNPHYYYLQASILLEQNRPEEASRLLKQALFLQNDFVLAHFSLGRLALEQQRLAEAIRHFNNTLSILNNFPEEEPVPAADGLTMGALRQMVLNIKNRLAAEPSPETQPWRQQNRSV